MCQVHRTGAYVSLLASGKTDYTVYALASTYAESTGVSDGVIRIYRRISSAKKLAVFCWRILFGVLFPEAFHPRGREADG